MKTKQKFKREYFKKSYDFTCCNCGCKQWAKPSMNMTQFGINSGCGSCLKCKEFLHLEIEGGVDGENMVSMLWDDFLKKEGIKPAKYIKGGETIKQLEVRNSSHA